MNNGWIALHRKLLDWEWWDDHNTTRLFLYLLLKANHEEKRWKGIEIKRGQLVTGLYALKKATGISVRSIRTSLKRLESTNEITRKTTNKYSVITINKYSDYQDKDSRTTSKVTSKVTNKRQASDKQTTTNNNDNNVTIKQVNNNKGEFQLNDFLEDFNLIRSYCLPNSRGLKTIDDKTKRQFEDRVEQGVTREDMQHALKMAFMDPWHKEVNWKHITPEFITRPDKFSKFHMRTEEQQKQTGGIYFT